MDSRIGVTGGQPPHLTLSGLPLPEQPYPTTIHLDDTHYVVLDALPLVDVDSKLEILRAGLTAPILPNDVPEDADEGNDDILP